MEAIPENLPHHLAQKCNYDDKCEIFNAGNGA
jgi:hypothetical protein